MKRVLSTALAVVLLLSLGALAVLARGGGDILTPADSVVAAAPQPQTAAAPDAPAAVTIRYNWITLPLENAAITKASELKTHIESNSNPSVSVEAVEEWQATGQGWRSYDPSLPPGAQDDLPVQVGHAYRVAIGGTGTDVTWSIVGNVPAPSVFTYSLEETADTDFNWIMIPLDKGAVTKASELKADIEAHSSGGVTVTAVEEWQATGQGYRSYDPSLPPGAQDDFTVKIGYPYRVSVDVTSGTTVNWPVR